MFFPSLKSSNNDVEQSLQIMMASGVEKSLKYKIFPEGPELIYKCHK